MVSMDIFRQDPFSMMELTSSIERVPYNPGYLSQKNFIFTDKPIITQALAVEERDGVLTVIPTSQRGQPSNSERTTEKRKMRYFQTPRLREGDTIYAHEIAGIREFGQETELMQVMTEAARRLSGPTGLQSQLAYTFEYHALAAVQGQLLDADGSTLYNWYDEFQIAVPAEIAFNLAAGVANSLRPIINALKRAMRRAAKGAMPPGAKIVALCGDQFYDLFTNHPDVIRTFVNWQAAEALRDGSQGDAFDTFTFDKIDWVNYQGSDDNATIAIATDKVKFFPANSPGVFERALSPAESFGFVNTPGKEFYVQPIFDRDRDEWWRQELSSYPLYICKRPEVLQTGRAGA